MSSALAVVGTSRKTDGKYWSDYEFQEHSCFENAKLSDQGTMNDLMLK